MDHYLDWLKNLLRGRGHEGDVCDLVNIFLHEVDRDELALAGHEGSVEGKIVTRYSHFGLGLQPRAAPARSNLVPQEGYEERVEIHSPASRTPPSTKKSASHRFWCRTPAERPDLPAPRWSRYTGHEPHLWRITPHPILTRPPTRRLRERQKSLRKPPRVRDVLSIISRGEDGRGGAKRRGKSI